MGKAIEYYKTHDFFYDLNEAKKDELIENSLTLSKLFLGENDYFGSGYILYNLIDVVWGKNDISLLFNVCSNAIDSLEKEISISESIEKKILSYNFIISILGRTIPLLNNDKESISEYLIALMNKLGVLIYDNFKENAHRKYFLVEGFRVEGSLIRNWTTILPFEESIIYKGGGSSYNIQSAFICFKNSEDYDSAKKIIEIDDDMFDTNHLKGWKEAILGFVNSKNEMIHFKKSFREFQKDYKEGWYHPSDLWAQYFQSRYYLSKAFNSNEFQKNLEESLIVLDGVDRGMINYQINKYKYLIESFVAFFILKDSSEISKSVDKIEKEIRNGTISTLDIKIRNFVEELSRKVYEIDKDPDTGIWLIADFGDLIQDFPLFISNPENSKKIIGKGFNDYLVGKTDWIYRTIKNIKQERILHKILLDLYRSQYPRFTQLVHGSFENGRDLFLLPKNSERLELIQVKIGDISLTEWRGIKQQLEEMMETDIPQTLNNKKITQKVGFLLFTGHFKPNVESAKNGWLAKRKEKMDEEYDFINLDDFVNYIIDNKLVAEFRKSAISNKVEIEI